MDTDAVLRRRPAVAIVDEFAHTNVPGSERLKRWQDVHALLDAGIDVIATMNVQHLESLNDQVWHVTGVRVRETLPDWVIDDADEVVFVDLTPQALRNRLERGVVYAPDKAQKAMDNFFTETNLSALREMGMRHTAHEVEEKLAAAPPAAGADIPVAAGSSPGPQAGAAPQRKDRILICLTGNPFSAVLIRRGKRVADYLQADCLAIHVAAPGEDRRRHRAPHELRAQSAHRNSRGGRSGSCPRDRRLCPSAAHHADLHGPLRPAPVVPQPARDGGAEGSCPLPRDASDYCGVEKKVGGD